MVKRSPSLKEKKVLVVAKGIESTRKSKADVARRIETLCSTFDVTIVTASPKECSSLFGGARIIGVPLPDIRKQSTFFILSCWCVLPFIRSEIVYLSELYNAPTVLTLFRRRIVCYGNTHPMQHIMSVQKGHGILATIISTSYRFLLKLGLRRCDLILSISPQLTSAFVRFGIRREKVQTLETGVPLEDFHPPLSGKPESSSVFTAVYHGTMSVQRGLRIMIDGAAILAKKRRDFRIRLLGCDFKQIESLKRELHALGLSDLVEPLPSVRHAEVPKILWTSDCGISLLEPNVYFRASPPLKVLEYMAAGLPVIANDLPTHRLYLEDHTDSLIIEFTPESFASALERLMDDERLRRDMSLNALRRSARHSDDEPVHRLIEYLS